MVQLKALVKTLTDAPDKEFNNTVTPPEEPKFQPEKYVVSKEKYDITGDKLVDDDSELTDKYDDTNANPYADNTINNEVENINTKTVERGSKLVYQVWLDTTKFDAANKDNIQSVGISDDYDETKLNLDASAIKAYDSVTGAEVTAKFDIASQQRCDYSQPLKMASRNHLAMQKTHKSSTQLNSLSDVTTSSTSQQQ